MTKYYIAMFELPDDHSTMGDPWSVATWLALVTDIDQPIVWESRFPDADTFFDYAHKALIDVDEQEWRARHPMYTLYVDEDGYICFYDKKDLKGPGIWWTLHFQSWEAFVDLPDEGDPIYETLDNTFPSDDDLAAAAEAYEKWLENHKEAE